MRFPGACIAMAVMAAAPIVSSAQVAQPAGAADFLHKAIEGDNSEVRLGALAQEHGSTPGVRDFGKVLQQDHAKARMEAGAVARALGEKTPTEMAPEAEAEFNKLQALGGPAFDQEFVGYMVDDHKKDIADFKAQAALTGPAATMARNQLPVLEKHLRIAQSLQAAPAGR